jgi:L-seryl-tRNA(Ser) seleniumtransferase
MSVMNPPDEKAQELLRLIPPVDELLEFIGKEGLAGDLPRKVLLDAARELLEETREAILTGSYERVSGQDFTMELIASMVTQRAWQSVRTRLRKVINATGVVLHTNLGRAPLSWAACEAAREVSEGYCNLEYQLKQGERGSRQEHLERWLCELTYAEAAMVVNNNAAAVLLAVSAIAKGKDVIVSRGELVEIGDSFRLPEIMAQGGARLVEVGTTNRTRLDDYRNVIGPETAALMKIHQSNFRMVGYTEEVSLQELVGLGRQQFLPVICDLGSGSLVDLDQWGLGSEPSLGQSVATGADIITASGDKLLGGPQAGIIVGSRDYVDALRKHPLARAVRVDKMTIAALEATLRIYLDPWRAALEIPALRMLTEDKESVKARARKLKRMVAVEGLEASIISEVSRAGGGTLPTAELPTFCLALAHAELDAVEMERRLRLADLPVLSRIKDDALLLDLRTVAAEEVTALARVINENL